MRRVDSIRRSSDLLFFCWFSSTKFDLTTRHTIYAVVIGGFAQWLKSNAISQNMIQRYLALPTLRDAKM